MYKTIVDLLKKLQLDHQLNAADPLLYLPLSLFTEEEYPIVVTILWLYKNDYVDWTRAIRRKPNLGEISAQHVEHFFNAILAQIKSSLTPSSIKDEEVKPLMLPKTPANTWVNIVQVSEWLSQNRVFRKMHEALKCTIEFDFVIKWINLDNISIKDCLFITGHLQELKRQNLYPLRIKTLVIKLLQTEHFSEKSAVAADAIHSLLVLLKQPKHKHQDNFSEEIIEFLTQLFTELATIHPATIESLLVSLGVDIPNVTRPELKLLLRKALKDLPAHQPNELPELLFYLYMFLSGKANLDPWLIQFRFTHAMELFAFKHIAQKFSDHFRVQLTQELNKRIFAFKNNDALSQMIDTELKRLYSSNSNVMSIMSCTSCALLTRTLVQIWGELGITIPDILSIPLTPIKNKYYLGVVPTETSGIDNAECFAMSANDFLIYSEMVDAMKAFNDINEKLMVASTTHVSPVFFPPKKAPAPKNIQSWQTPKSANTDELEPLQKKIDELRRKISDPQLQRNLTLQRAGRYANIVLIDPYALCQLLACYGINSNKDAPPNTPEISKLINKMKDSLVLSQTIRHIVACKLLIDLDNHHSLRGQLKDERASLEALNEKIRELTLHQILPQFKFQLEWCYLQRIICEKLQYILINKMKSLHMTIDPIETNADNRIAPR